ncbi:MAG TPA: GGDEF domain-containing protein [Saccharofermentans sp.]|nr:GGDEF domain-containing protein [Saccharofermentans sp.]HUM24474.1 GGDEF domain-containing protein [Saccharofermentans sp.]
MEEVRNDEFVYPVERSELDRLCLEMVREYSCDSVYFKDRNSHFLWNSKQHAAQVGVESAEDMLGKCDFDFFPETFAQAARNIEIEIMRTGMPRLNIAEELERPSGKAYFLASKYPFFNEKNEIIGTWGISHNITDQKSLEKELEKSNQKLQRLARVDDLTGLYNRRYFYETLDRMISIYEARKDDNLTFAILAIDIDGMKYINDQYGHPNGDDVLRMVASSLICNTKKADSSFRVGGDEFMILVPDCDKKSAIILANKLACAIADTRVPMGDKFEKITISLGLSVYEKGMDVSELISSADRKLYKSKRNGKNQVSF